MPPHTNVQSLPWHHRFRTRLIVTFFLILAAVIAASLWIAEKRFSEVYQSIFETQFQAFITAFDKSRADRFEAIGSKLGEIAATPALISHFKGGADKSIRPLLETLLQELGRQRLSSESEQLAHGRRSGSTFAPPGLPRDRGVRSNDPARPGESGNRPPQPPQPPFFFLLDAAGHPLQDLNSSVRPKGSERARESQSFIKLGSRTLADVLPQQEVGYKLVEIPGETRQQVREIFVTPIQDTDGTLLGGLVFGLPLPTLDERALYQQSGRMEQGKILSGIWLENQIVSSTIPESKQSELAQLIGQSIEDEDASKGDLTVAIDGRRHRVIYRILNPDSPFERAAQINLYSLAPVDAEIASFRLAFAKIALFALLVSLGLILIVSRRLSGPVSLLTEATRQIAARNYAFRVPVKSQDEIGLLTKAFNEMTADLALQDRYRSVLHAVADPAVAQRLIHDHHDLGGVQKQVTTLFCDIRGFTSLSEQLAPPVVIELVNHHMTALTGVAYQFGGTVDKFVGDMIMVLFGAPESAQDDAERAVRCAIAMREARSRLNLDCPKPLEIGIGIATGPVIAGCMGSEKRLNYTVLGHSVNLAARLCGIAAPGQIIIDQFTHAQLPPEVETQPQPPIRLKGISEEVLSHTVLTQS